MFNIYQEYSPSDIKHELMSTELDASILRDAIIITCDILDKMKFELAEMKKHIRLLTALAERDRRITDMESKTYCAYCGAEFDIKEQAEADKAELCHKLHLEMESSEHYSSKCYDLLCELDNAKREKEQAERAIEKIEAICAEVRLKDNSIEWRSACDEILDRIQHMKKEE